MLHVDVHIGQRVAAEGRKRINRKHGIRHARMRGNLSSALEFDSMSLAVVESQRVDVWRAVAVNRPVKTRGRILAARQDDQRTGSVSFHRFSSMRRSLKSSALGSLNSTSQSRVNSMLFSSRRSAIAISWIWPSLRTVTAWQSSKNSPLVLPSAGFVAT